MARTNNLSNFLTDVADAIRTKKGSEELIAAEDFDTEIENLPSSGGLDWSTIGYTKEPALIKNGYDYAKEIYDNWDNSITNLYQKFRYNNDLLYFPKVDTSNATAMGDMFRYAYGLQYVDIDASNATNISNMFDSCFALKYVKIKTSNKLTSATGWLWYTYCLDELDVSEMDVSGITNFASFFRTSGVKELDLTNFDTSNQTSNSMALMFNSCTRLKKIKFGSNFNTSAITNMSSMFNTCTELEEIIGLEYFDTTNVTNMSDMFSLNGVESLERMTSLDLSSFYTPALTNTAQMFSMRTKLKHIDMRNFDFTNVTSHSNMFGSGNRFGVPDDCEIIVNSQTEKEWITSKWSRLTNVKTIAEYEAEQNA